MSGAEVLAELNARINTIEEAYEFMLAYASQGLSSDKDNDTGRQAREYLTRCDTALVDFGAFLIGFAERLKLEPLAPYRAFIAAAFRQRDRLQSARRQLFEQRGQDDEHDRLAVARAGRRAVVQQQDVAGPQSAGQPSQNRIGIAVHGIVKEHMSVPSARCAIG